MIEGYECPRDNRLTKLGTFAGLGVLEVNIHPAKNWSELVNHYDILFEEARLSRLSSVKLCWMEHTGVGALGAVEVAPGAVGVGCRDGRAQRVEPDAVGLPGPCVLRLDAHRRAPPAR